MSPRRSLAALVVVTLPFAAACGAGKNNETERVRTSPYVANASTGTMLVRGVSVIIAAGATFGSPSASGSPSPHRSASAPGSASPSPSASSTASPTGPQVQAYIVGTLVNAGSSPDTVTDVTAGSGTVRPSPANPAALTVRPAHPLMFVDPDVSGAGQSLVISGVTSPLLVGTSVSVSFTFRDAGTVTLQAPVRDVSTAGTTQTATPVYFTGNYPSPSAEVPTAASPRSFEPSSP